MALRQQQPVVPRVLEAGLHSSRHGLWWRALTEGFLAEQVHPRRQQRDIDRQQRPQYNGGAHVRHLRGQRAAQAFAGVDQGITVYPRFTPLKYRPEFPDRFGSKEHARGFCQQFFPWYNTEHHHSGLGLLTPEVVHTRRAEHVRGLRQHTLDAAFAAHPERFVRKPPQPPSLPTEVWINPPPKPESAPSDSEKKAQ